MEALFLNESVQTLEAQYQLNKALLKSKSLIFIIFDALIVLLAIVSIFGGDYFMVFFLLIIAVLFPFFPFLLSKTLVKKVYKTNKIMQNNPVNKFSFYEDYLEVETVSENFQGKSKVNYNTLYKSLCNDNYIFIFINKQQAFMVDKSAFIKGSAEEMIDFLRKKNIKIKKA